MSEKEFSIYWYQECLEKAIEEDNFEKVKIIVKNGRKRLGEEPLVTIVTTNGRRINLFAKQ